MFKLPSRSKFSNVNHESELKRLVEGFTKGLTEEEQKRVDRELEYCGKINLHSHFLFLYEITSLLRDKGFLFCAWKELSSSYIAYLLKITRMNPVTSGVPAETFFDSFKVLMPDTDERRIAIAEKEFGRDHVEKIYGRIENVSVFEVVESDYDAILHCLGEYFGYQNIAIPLSEGPAQDRRTGYCKMGLHAAAIAFLPDNVCQQNSITLEFHIETPAIPTIYASVRKCPFFGIEVVSFLSRKLQKDTNLDDPNVVRNIVMRK